MKLQILLVKTFSESDSLVVVCDTAGQALKAGKSLLNRDEFEYLKNSYENNKKGFVRINRLRQHLFFYVISYGKKPEHLIHEELRKAGHQMLSFTAESKIDAICIYSKCPDHGMILAFTEGIALSSYQFSKYKSKTSETEHCLKMVKIIAGSVREKQMSQLRVLTESVHICRDLVNEPVCNMNSQIFSEYVEALFQNTGVKTEFLNKPRIEALKMNGLLAVNKGSIDPPAFIIIEWKPQQHHNKKPYVFVGKGLMYDTGGINIKTASGMEEMKGDMAGGAAVVASIYALAKEKFPVYVVGLVPVTDNRPAGNALVPGDIITYANGTSVEVLNSDAEGRLILADGLLYAKKYKPQLVITVATLTGAAHAAIGNYGMAGMHQHAQKHFKDIQSAGNDVFERVVEFPFWDDYDELIKSDIADIKNTGGRYAGAITAGKFLARFTTYPFIHLDIAGPAFSDKKDSYRGTGGSGVGVRLLYRFIERKR